MAAQVQGQLVPQGGGDAIPLIRPHLVMGRRDSCDIRLPFPNVSGVHCELLFKEGCWILQDLNSTNGVKVNNQRVQKKVLQPGDTITIAKRNYTIEYQMTRGNRALEELLKEDEQEKDLFSESLMEKAGLVHPPRSSRKTPPPPDDDE